MHTDALHQLLLIVGDEAWTGPFFVGVGDDEFVGLCVQDKNRMGDILRSRAGCLSIYGATELMR